MKWQGRRKSNNVEDRRGSGGSRSIIGGGLGIVTIVIVLIATLFGGDPGDLLNGIFPQETEYVDSYVPSADEVGLVEFVSVVLAETEDIWTVLFENEGLIYENPTLVLYTDSVDSACGTSSSSTGPFYCPGDQSVYIDLSFFQDLKTKFKAPGDFAMAYVIAHEVGHHVQYLLGITEQVFELKSNVSESEFNEYLVRLELQADYFSGVWAHYVNREELLEPGDIEEALRAASAVGDDRIQKETRGYVVPDSFTHGTSEQRSRWFNKGYISGNIKDGDTFNTDVLRNVSQHLCNCILVFYRSLISQ